jgi:hypothetical protein
MIDTCDIDRLDAEIDEVAGLLIKAIDEDEDAGTMRALWERFNGAWEEHSRHIGVLDVLIQMDKRYRNALLERLLA